MGLAGSGGATGVVAAGRTGTAGSAATADTAARAVTVALRGVTDRATVDSAGVEGLVGVCTSATGRTRVRTRPGDGVSNVDPGADSWDEPELGNAAVGGWVDFGPAATSIVEVVGSLDGVDAELSGVPLCPVAETGDDDVADAAVDLGVVVPALRGAFLVGFDGLTGLAGAAVSDVAEGLLELSFAADADALPAAEEDEDADDDGEPAEPSAPVASA